MEELREERGRGGVRIVGSEMQLHQTVEMKHAALTDEPDESFSLFLRVLSYK